uniref:Transthyretin-like family protein n=1 Tax=Steinernema glaseri TaxID=37863 RepID=A0A1I8A7R5_9BILA
MRPLVLFLTLIVTVCAFRKQTVGIKGKLLCGDSPLVGAEVKLWDEDTGPDPDDLLDSGTSGADGSFQLSGSETETTNIDPKFKVYHNCNNKWPCKRKVTFTIPDKYINGGSQVGKWFEIGTLNMETIFEKEDRKCF